MAGVIAWAFDPALRCGQSQMLGALGAFYAVLAALALYRLHRRGELRQRFRAARGDITLAAVTAGVLYGTTRIAGSVLAAHGSPRELWIMRVYLQVGDLSAPGRKLLGAAVFVVAALEEIVWRGLVMRSIQDVTSGPRAAGITTVLYAAAHLPTLVPLFRMPGVGPEPPPRPRRPRLRRRVEPHAPPDRPPGPLRPRPRRLHLEPHRSCPLWQPGLIIDAEPVDLWPVLRR